MVAVAEFEFGLVRVSWDLTITGTMWVCHCCTPLSNPLGDDIRDLMCKYESYFSVLQVCVISRAKYRVMSRGMCDIIHMNVTSLKLRQIPPTYFYPITTLLLPFPIPGNYPTYIYFVNHTYRYIIMNHRTDVRSNPWFFVVCHLEKTDFRR